MPIQRINFLGFVLILVLAMATFQGIVEAQDTTPPLSKGAADTEKSSSLSVSDLISFSTELSERLSDLQRNVELDFDLSGFEKDLAKTQEQLKVLSVKLKEIKADGRLGYQTLSGLKEEIVELDKEFEKKWKPFASHIKQVDRWSNEWSQDKERLLALESSLSKDESYKMMRPMVVRAEETIDKAKKLISDNLKSLLTKESKFANIQGSANLLVAEIDELLGSLRRDWFQKSAPSMFSSEFYGQFNTAPSGDLRQGLKLISVSQWRILQRKTLFIMLQIAFWFIFAVLIFYNRVALGAEPRLFFLAERPFAAGLLIGSMALFPYHEAGLGIWRVVISAAVAFSVARLSGHFITGLWRRRAVYGMFIVLIIHQLLQFYDLAQPLFRLYILIVSLIGLFLCLWRMPTTVRQEELRLYRWALRGGIAVCGMIVVANISGYSALAAHLLVASLGTVLIFLLGWILIESGRGGLAWVFKRSSVTRFPILEKNATAIIHVLSHLFNLLVGAFITVYLLVSWGFYNNGAEALGSVMSMGFTIGSWKVNVGIILTVVLCLYGSLLISRAVQSILSEEVFPRRRVEKGVQISMGHLIHYAILLVGFLLALAALGVNFTNITIIGGALGVGIGFGLQTIVNNFVSGLILLFERPVRIGDYIEIQGLWGEIKKIGLRATTVETFDRADIVIPNSDLVANQVTNWTRTNRLVRLTIPVGVAYGSDVPLVMKILLECAQENPSVMSSPGPQVLFRGFGDSSLDFELRVFLSDIDYRLIAQSEILQEIDREFRLNDVEIPFPQRDLHLRSVESPVTEAISSSTLSNPTQNGDEETP
jgi:small-conductance mechanosensitive channel